MSNGISIMDNVVDILHRRVTVVNAHPHTLKMLFEG